MASAPITLCPGTARLCLGAPQQAKPPVQILGVWRGVHCSWGAGTWVQANEWKGEYNLCLFEFLHACDCVRGIRFPWCLPCPPQWLTPSLGLALPEANCSDHTTGRGQHTLYFQPQTTWYPGDLLEVGGSLQVGLRQAEKEPFALSGLCGDTVVPLATVGEWGSRLREAPSRRQTCAGYACTGSAPAR